MSTKSFFPTHSGDEGGFAELCKRRRQLESDIAHQEVRIAEVLSHLISPLNVTTALSGFAMNRVKSGFSLFRWIDRGWQWLSFARRFIKRFM